MIRIAVTPGHPRPDEAQRIAAILEAGWDYVHLRFPDTAPDEVGAIVETVDPALRHRLTIHDHFNAPWAGLAGGVHLNRRNPTAPVGWSGRVSLSCHTVADIASATAFAGRIPDYVTFSPVFASHSKPGYGGDSAVIRAMTHEPACLGARFPIVALGGIDPTNCSGLRTIGFGGYAVLGYLAEADSVAGLRHRLEEFDA